MFRHNLEYILFRTTFAIISLFPFRTISWFGSIAGTIVYRTIGLRKNVVMKNLQIAFPELNESERISICNDNYKNFGRTFFEYMVMHSRAEKIIEKYVVFDNPQIAKEFASYESACIGVTGHFGNFEFLGSVISSLGKPTTGIVKEMKNPKIEKYLQDLRKKSKMNIVKVKDGFKKIVETVKNKDILLIVSDQDAGPNGVFVDFFGIKSSTPPGTALIAQRNGLPVYVGHIVREKPFGFRVFLDKIEYDKNESSKDKLIMDITQKYTKILEKFVRKYPDHYFWMHKKWKSSNVEY